MKKLLTFIASLFICWVVNPTSLVSAQSTTLSVNPSVLEILLRPNQSIQQTLTLHTDGSSLEVTPELYRATPIDSQGHVQLDPHPVNPLDLPLVIAANPPLSQPVAVTGNSLPFTLTLSAASSDTSQDVYLAVVFRARALDTPLSGSATLPAISSLLMLTITPDGLLPINLTVQNFDPPLFHDSASPFSFHPQLVNSTPNMIRPAGTLSILNSRGTIVKSLPLYPHLIAGNSSRDLAGNCAEGNALASICDLTWQSHFSNLGPYRFRLTITTQGGTKLSETEKIVWLLPIRLLFLIFIFLSLLLILLSQAKHRLSSHQA